MKVYVCLEWKKRSFDEIFKGEWRIVKAVKDELSARKWCGFETNSLDETGHLDCSDFNDGLLEWSEKEQTYYRTLHDCSWEVELIGISDVSYW